MATFDELLSGISVDGLTYQIATTKPRLYFFITVVRLAGGKVKYPIAADENDAREMWIENGDSMIAFAKKSLGVG